MRYQQPFGVTDTDASYVNGDPSVGRAGSIPPAGAFEEPQREIANIISNSGQTPSDDDLNQLTRAVRDGKLIYMLDTGDVNSLQVLSPPGTNPGLPITSYAAGRVINVFVQHTNTGPSVIAQDGLGPRAIKRADGSELQAGDLVAGMVACLVDTGTYYQLQNFLGVGGSGGGTSTFIVDIPYVVDSSVIANSVIGPYSPAIAEREGLLVEVKLANVVTGATNFTPNTNPTRRVVHGDGSDVVAGDGAVGEIWILIFDGVHWQLIGKRAGSAVIPVSTGSGRSLLFFQGPISYSGHPALIRTPTVSGNRTTWTFSAFVQRTDTTPIDETGSITTQNAQGWFSAGSAQLGGDFTGMLLYGYGGSNQPFMDLAWNNSNTAIDLGHTPDSFATVGVFNDLLWHHFLMVADGQHLSVYQDGVLVAIGPISGLGAVNSTRPQYIGIDADDLFGVGVSSWYGTRAYMAEIIMVDGLALAWNTFAQNVSGVFIPKTYAGPWGLNGFYLNFSDSSAATATTLGKDYSGNGNNFTPINVATSQVTTNFPG